MYRTVIVKRKLGRTLCAEQRKGANDMNIDNYKRKRKKKVERERKGDGDDKIIKGMGERAGEKEPICDGAKCKM